MMKELRKAIVNAEKTLGFEVDVDAATEVLMYTVKKCKMIGKDASYLPVLFETELLDYFFRMAVNTCAAGRGV